MEITADNIEKKLKESLLLPIKQIKDIEYTPPEYLIDQLLVKDTVGFISASPGSTKTWLAWEMALSVATGTKCFGVFEATKGKVLAFNAEDSPGAVTKPRLSALASAREININDVDNFNLIDVPTLMLDDDKTKTMIDHTIDHHRPDFILFDPFRQVHTQNEDKASEMAPILAFLRGIQRRYKCTIHLVCHERKGSSERRADMTRGSNVLEGWRDTAIYMNRPDKDKKTSVQIYHRGYLAPEPFFFELCVENVRIDDKWIMKSAVLEYISEKEKEGKELADVCIKVFNTIKMLGETTTSEVAETVKIRKSTVIEAVDNLLMRDVIVRKSKKLLINSTGNETILRSSDIYQGTIGNVPF